MSGRKKRVSGCFLKLTLLAFALAWISHPVPAQADEGDACGEQPVNICIMLDRTGSVSDSERANEAAAAKTLIDIIAAENNGTRVAIGRFGDQSNGGLEAEIASGGSITAVTPGNAASIKTVITNALSSGSSVGTNVRDAINVCQNHLTANNNGKQNIIILISDMDPSEPSGTADSSALTAATTAKTAGTRIFSIGFDVSGETSADETNRSLGAQIASGIASDNFCTASNCDHNGTDEIALENADGDDWFLAPMANELQAVFANIFNVLLCEDDGSPCTVESCENDLCVSDPIEGCCTEDEDCDDGNFCNGEEVCGDNDTCQAGTPKTCDDEDPCTIDSCDEEGNECDSTPKNCDDNIACTIDTCDASGECKHDNSQCQCRIDADCNDNEVCTDEVCDTSTFTCKSSNNSKPCEDDLFCNGKDTCGDGTCSVHTGDPCSEGGECADQCDEEKNSCNDPSGTICTDDGNSCTDNQCNGAGECVPVNNDDSCDDENPCTLDDVCSGGKCEPGTPKDCDDGIECTVDSCNSDSRDGECVNNDAGCECEEDIECDDGNPCTDEVCNDQRECEYADNTASCDDGLFCNGTDVCSEGECTHGGDPCTTGGECSNNCDEENNSCNDPAGTTCTDDGNVCTDNQCNGNGDCVPVNNTADCSDKNPCTLGDKCGGGDCVPGDPKDCSDGIECTVDSCDPATENGQCVNDAKGCECTQDIHCDDGNPCTNEVCNDQNECEYTNNTDSCDDGLFCNGTDVCSEGECTHGGDPCAEGGECADSCDEETNSCNDPAGTTCADDGNVCTDNQCNGDGQCVPVNNTADCTDDDPCTLDDVCAGGDCVPGDPKDCSDGIECTVDTCDSNNDGQCVNDDLGCECNDDTDCDDENSCTDEVCNDQNECEYTNNTDSCDDGIFCNGPDTCSEGDCTHDGDPCAGGGECADSCDEETDSCNDPSGTSCTDDGNVCTDNECNGDGECVPINNGADCDDEDLCTLGDVCSEGQCQSGEPKDCSDDRECSSDSCEQGQCINDLSECACSEDPDCDDGNSCTEDSCNVSSGTCSNEPLPGAECDDGNGCTQDDLCDSEGICAGSPLVCNDGNACTTDSCEESTGECSFAAIPGCGPPGACPDQDQDDVCDDVDNCPGDFNPDQLDEDGDGIGAVCDGEDSGIAGTQGFQLRGNTAAGAFGCGSSNSSVEVPVSAAMTGPSLITLGVIGIGLLRRYTSKRKK